MLGGCREDAWLTACARSLAEGHFGNAAVPSSVSLPAVPTIGNSSSVSASTPRSANASELQGLLDGISRARPFARQFLESKKRAKFPDVIF
jgi:hypothetical protein